MSKMRRSKASRMRGHKTHGYGAMKKHRGAGHRGGRGNAGSGKRGDAKKPSYLGIDYMGKHGFKKKGLSIPIFPINLSTIEEMLPHLIEQEIAVKKGEVYEIDLSAVGFNKLLGKGRIASKIKVTVAYATAKAVEKVSAGGGEVVTNLNKGESE